MSEKTFTHWLFELNLKCVEYGLKVRYTEEDDKWRDYYEGNFTPEEALLDDMEMGF